MEAIDVDGDGDITQVGLQICQIFKDFYLGRVYRACLQE